ncbi:22908_t:CDS:2, partial [Dentiscutata erythropus]
SSKSLDEKEHEDHILGVLPYIAPEQFQKEPNETEGWINISESISVRSTVFQKPSDTVYNETEKLFSLLKKRKDYIDRILKSQLVYAIGPDFQNDYSMPYIACWVAKPLDKTVMNEISSLFDDKFGVIYHLVNAKDISSQFETDDKKESRNFNITIDIWANVGLDSHTRANTLTVEYRNSLVKNVNFLKASFVTILIRSNEADGVQWSYQFTGDDMENIGKVFQRMKSILVIDILPTPKLLQQYPNLVHKLEISFNKISNFNNDFVKLTRSVHSAPNHTPEDKQPPIQEHNTEFKCKLSS